MARRDRRRGHRQRRARSCTTMIDRAWMGAGPDRIRHGALVRAERVDRAEFGELTADAADAAADLLGRPLADPIEIFVYDGREEFLGAVGPAPGSGWARPPTRTSHGLHVAGGGIGVVPPNDDRARGDARRLPRRERQPVHAPATWLNEGVATWSEVGNADTEADLVQSEANSADGLMAFEALTASSRSTPVARAWLRPGRDDGRPHHLDLRNRCDGRDHGRLPIRAPPMARPSKRGPEIGSMTSAPSTSPRSGSASPNRSRRCRSVGRTSRCRLRRNPWRSRRRHVNRRKRVVHRTSRGGSSSASWWSAWSSSALCVARAPSAAERRSIVMTVVTRPATGCIRPGWISSMALALGALGFVAAAQWNSEVQRTSYTTSAQQALAAQAVGSSRSRSCSGPARRGRAETADIQRRARVADLTGRGERAVGRDAPGSGPDPRPRAGGRDRDCRLAARALSGREPGHYLVLADDLRDLVAALWAPARRRSLSTGSGSWPRPRSTASARRSWSTPPSCRRHTASRPLAPATWRSGSVPTRPTLDASPSGSRPSTWSSRC